MKNYGSIGQHSINRMARMKREWERAHAQHWGETFLKRVWHAWFCRCGLSL